MGTDAHNPIQASPHGCAEIFLLLEAALFRLDLQSRREDAWAFESTPTSLTEAAIVISAPCQGYLRLRCDGAAAIGLGVAQGAQALLGVLTEGLVGGPTSNSSPWAWELLAFPLRRIELGEPAQTRRLRIAGGWVDLDHWPRLSAADAKDEG